MIKIKNILIILLMIFLFVVVSCNFSQDPILVEKKPQDLKINGSIFLKYQKTILKNNYFLNISKYNNYFWASSFADNLYVFDQNGIIIKKINLTIEKNEYILGNGILSFNNTFLVTTARENTNNEKNFFYSWSLTTVDKDTYEVLHYNINEVVQNILGIKYPYTIQFKTTINGSLKLEVRDGICINYFILETYDLENWNIVDDFGEYEYPLPGKIYIHNNIFYKFGNAGDDDEENDRDDLFVSCDGGIDWYNASLGTNHGYDILFDDNKIIIACGPHVEHDSSGGTQKIGGGIVIYELQNQ